MFQNVFQVIIQIIYGFLFSELQRKGIILCKLLVNPDTQSGQSDLRSSCFGPRASVLVLRFSQVLSYIYGGARYPEMSGALRCYLIGVSLHLVIFKKGSIKPYIKMFSNLSAKFFMGFYFGVCREPLFLCIM